MDKNEAFGIVYSLCKKRIQLTGEENDFVNEALSIIAKEIKYESPKEEPEDEMEDLEKPRKK